MFRSNATRYGIAMVLVAAMLLGLWPVNLFHQPAALASGGAGEINLAASALGVAATASSVSSDRPPTNVNDGDASTQWGPLTADKNTGEVWLSLDFGRELTFDRIKLSFVAPEAGASLPLGYEVKVLEDPAFTGTYADDPAVWRTIAIRSYSDYALSTMDDVGFGQEAAQRVTVVFTVDPAGSIPRIQELELYQLSFVGALNLAAAERGTEASASSVSSDRPPGEAHDGVYATHWGPLTADKNTGEVWISLDFVGETSFDRLLLDFIPPGTGTSLPLSYQLKVLDDPSFNGTYADDPSRWSTVISRSYNDYAALAKEDVSFNAAVGERVALVFSVDPAGSIPRIQEIELYSMPDDAYDSMREKWANRLIGEPGYDPQDPDIQAAIQTMESTALTYLNSMNAPSGQASYLWSDHSSGSIGDAEESYDRLLAMAKAYNLTESTLDARTKTQMLYAIVKGMEFLHANWYNPAVAQTTQWYKFEIGVPKLILDLNVLMYEELIAMGRQSLILDHMAAIHHFSPHPAHTRTATSQPRYDYMTGANLVEKSLIVALRGVLLKSPEAVALSQDHVVDALDYVTSGDGFYEDGSFIQHVDVPYTGSYGLVMVGSLPALLGLLDGSEWEVTDSRVQHVFAWVYDSFEPVFFRGLLMDMIRGRAISRYHLQDWNAGMSYLYSLADMAEFAPAADAANFRGTIKQWAETSMFENFYEGASIFAIHRMKSIVDDSGLQPRAMPVYHKQFPAMDRIVHHRPGFSFAISMSSSRISTYEYAGPPQEENRRGYYTGDGMTYLYDGDLGQFSDVYWPTVDAKRLPGITVDAGQSRADGSGNGYLPPEDWVGGTEIAGLYGIAGMRLNGWDNSLAANKSWFMFDDEVVALGSGITSTDHRMIETVVDNRRLNENGDNALTVDGVMQPSSLPWASVMNDITWAHLAGSDSDIGYYFPGSADIKGLREARSGKWSDINPYVVSTETETTVTRNYLSLALEHGTDPTNDTYAYVILPNQSSQEVSEYAGSPDITIIENSAEVQAVKEQTLNIVAANFWQDGVHTADIITSDTKASVMTHIDGGTMEVSVSDPTQLNTGIIGIEIARSASAVETVDPRITVVRMSPTIQLEVDVSDAKGKAIQASFTLHEESNEWTSSPVDDAYVKSGVDAGTNFGSASLLQVKGTQNVDLKRKAYLKFDVSGVNSVDSATLRLYGVTNAVGGGTVNLYRATSDQWDESSITWNQAPGRAPTVLDSVMVGATARYVEFDVTAAVQNEDGEITFVLEGVESEDILFQFESEESSAPPPELQIFQ